MLKYVLFFCIHIVLQYTLCVWGGGLWGMSVRCLVEIFHSNHILSGSYDHDVWEKGVLGDVGGVFQGNFIAVGRS